MRALWLLIAVGCGGTPGSLKECLLAASQRGDAQAMGAAAALCRESFGDEGGRAATAERAGGAVEVAKADRPARPGPEAAPRAGYLGPSCELTGFQAACGSTRVDGGNRGFVLLERCLCVVDMSVGWDCIGLTRLDVTRYHSRPEVCQAAANLAPDAAPTP